jgi:integrase
MSKGARRTAGPRRDAETGTWWFVVDVGQDPNGRRRQVRRRGFKTKREAQEAFDRLKVKAHDHEYVAPSRQTVAEYLDEWLGTIQRQPSTIESYARNIRVHVVPRIGGRHLRSIDAGTLNAMYADLLRDGRADGKPGGLAPRTVRYVHTILGRAFEDAVKWGRLNRNPARSAEPPRPSDSAPPEMQTWTGDQLGSFLAGVEGDRYHAPFLFIATTGVRRGEALGIRWGDLDLDAGRASIRQTITAVRHKIVIAPRTKTDKGRRIDLDEATVAMLRRHRAQQAQERLLVGAGYAAGDLVFALPDGRPYHPERFSREFDRKVARTDLPRIRLHDLRHTWATLALEAGISVKVVSERLGHATSAITSDTYSHVSPTMGTDAAERVARMIFGA